MLSVTYVAKYSPPVKGFPETIGQGQTSSWNEFGIVESTKNCENSSRVRGIEYYSIDENRVEPSQSDDIVAVWQLSIALSGHFVGYLHVGPIEVLSQDIFGRGVIQISFHLGPMELHRASNMIRVIVAHV